MNYDEDQPPLPLPNRNWQAVPASRSGYIQSIDNAALLSLAREHKTIVRMECGFGAFVVRDSKLASLALEAPPEKDIIADLQAAYVIHHHRTVERVSAFDRLWIWRYAHFHPVSMTSRQR